MRNEALHYYRQGYNCSQCILKAAEAVYKIPLTECNFDMCNGINTGLGIGSTCSVLVAGVMVFGALFDASEVKRLRMKLFDACMERYHALDCYALQKESRSRGCESVVSEIAALIDGIIQDECAKRT